ncbi:MAG: TAT-variant-translocated molybdopterin oxidoreductase [Crocinitomicaceae bacterium]|nr:TAT-variant-translocated molybdopterin oxidoreductase [Crocinitomicaceae bacterium]
MTRKYWKGIEELKETPQFLESRDQEFPAQTSVEEFLSDESLQETSTARRDFLKFLGFSVAAATVAACEAPVTKVIPYVNKPENVTPGLATWYASTFYDGNSYASILVKTREGRPIFIKGNKDYGITKGGVNPQIIASVLGLYDSARLQTPTIDGVEKPIAEVDKGIMDAVESASRVVLVSNTIISPSMQGAVGTFGATIGSDKFEHIQYDAASYAGMRQANKDSFGLTVDAMHGENPIPVEGEEAPMPMPSSSDAPGIIPDYDFSKAKTIVSVGADFLNSWLLPTQFAGQYGERRNPDGEWMSQHYQFESIMSITGSNADKRAMIKPSEEANVLAYLLKKLGVSNGGVSTTLSEAATAVADRAFEALKASKADSLVVAGSNNAAVQTLANKLNTALGAYNSTINLNNPINMFMGDDAAMETFAKSVADGKEANTAVIFYGVNPVYTLSNGAEFASGLSGMKASLSMSLFADETASNCTYVCPDQHALEQWADMSVTKSHYAMAQPTIRPLMKTASALESFMVWANDGSKRGGTDSQVAYNKIKENWEVHGFPMQTKYTDAHTYWNMVVHNSCDNEEAPSATGAPFNDGALNGISGKLPKAGSDREIVMYQKAGMGTGAHANNPWLQEMPDPMTKATWDNYITMNPVEMEKEGYATTFDQEHGLGMAKVIVGSAEMTLPVFPLPGQAIGTVGIALGYGRGSNGENIGKAAYHTAEYGGHIKDENGNLTPIGANAFTLVGSENGTMSYNANGSVTKVEGTYSIAATQIHQTVMGRHSIVRETTKTVYDSRDKEAYNPAYTLQKMDAEGNHVDAPMSEFDLWDEHPVEKIGHRWGMTIDLSSCIGCGSCLIACQAENNVPVVGKDEVRRGREMHWLRIDRYFASDLEAAPGTRLEEGRSKMDFFKNAEIAAENPQVVHMPMMCHHCNHAPCETVCPVAATTHSNEGLNMMAYNRCIGTRYCANNCPYKVRRFNWFNYPSYKAQAEINPAQDDLGRMVLNPDVTVRTRGVMEKCSMCVQRIQEGKLDAKKDGRPVVDGDISSACSDVCPTNAITIGDWNDLTSMLRASADDKRSYQALEEVGVKPNVWFKVKVRNEVNQELADLQTVAHVEHSENEEHAEEGHEDNSHH